MTKARDFAAFEWEFMVQDTRFTSMNWPSRLVFMYIWGFFSHERREKVAFKSLDHLTAQIQLWTDCPNDIIKTALDDIFNSRLAVFHEQSLLVKGVRTKNSTLRSWQYELTPDELALFSHSEAATPFKGEISPLEGAETIPSRGENHPFKGEKTSLQGAIFDPSVSANSPERELNVNRNRTGTERREDQQPLGSSPPPADPEPPPGSSPPPRPVHSPCLKLRTPKPETKGHNPLPSTPGGGKRPLSDRDARMLQELHAAMTDGESGITKAIGLLQRRMKLKPWQATDAVKYDPQRLCEWIYSALTEGANPAGLLVQYLKSRPDFRGLHIYEAVKCILFEMPEGALQEVLAGGER